MRRITTTFFAIFAGILFFAHAAFATSGFVTSPLWLTPEYPKEGDMATLSVAFRNEDAETITGTILFYDIDTLLAKKPITIPGNQIGTAQVVFRVAAGDHSFSATMSTVSKKGPSGTMETIALPEGTVKLPDQFISKKISLSAQASGDAVDASEAPILKQIDKAQEKVLAAIPENTKESISAVVTKVEDWRSEKADVFTTGAADAKTSIENAEKTKAKATVTQVPGSTKVVVKDAPTPPGGGPLTYIKLWAFTVFGYLFRTAILFYLIGILLVYFILRFIFRKIAKAIHRKKSGGSTKAEH